MITSVVSKCDIYLLIGEHWMFLKPLIGCLFIILSVPSFAYGEWEFSGFASIGAGRLDTEDVRYIDFTDEWSFNSDSVVGAQAQIELSDHWSFISQVVASGYDYTEDDPYTPKVGWFVFGYQINPSTQARIGRFRTPQYMYSTTLEVGYTYQWVRPSQNAYPLFMSPFKHLDGFDLTHSMSLEDVDLTYQVFAGTTEGTYEGVMGEASWSFGGNVTAVWSEFTARISGHQLNLSIEYPGFKELGLVAGYENLAAAYAADPDAQAALLLIPDSFDADEQITNYISLGFAWERNNWILSSELMHYRSEDRNFANDADGYYISVAYQWDDISPYIMIGEYHNRFSDDVKNKVIASEQYIPQGDNPTLDGLRATTIEVFDLFNVNQETITLGVRYDFHPKADFKFEVEYFNFLSDSYGNFYPENGSSSVGTNAVLTSFVIDVVF